LIKTQYLKVNQVLRLAQRGCADDILAHYYDIDRNEVKADWYNRRLSIDLAQLRNIDNVIALAAGKEKTRLLLVRCVADM